MDRVGVQALPQSLEAEVGLLGSLMISSSDAANVFERLSPEHFFSKRHEMIYEGIVAVFDEHGNVDLILLGDRLARDGVLDEVGGLSYLTELTEAVQTSVNAERYSHIILERALLRNLIESCNSIVKDALESGEEATQQLDRAEQRIFEIAEFRKKDDAVPMREAIKSTFDLIDRWAKGNTGLPTGYLDLDRITAGLQPSELVVVAGRPSMGKTTLSMNIATNVALNSKKGVAIFSLEVDRRQLAMNMLCGIARVKSQELRTVSLGTRDWQRLTSAADLLSDAPVFIDDSAGLNCMAIRAKARRLKAKHDIDLVVIDYLQLMEHGMGRPENRQQEISSISRALKGLARELEVPIICLSQLSRAVEQRTDHRPLMSDLRESGAIEQDADLVLLLYREEYYHPEREEARGKAEVIVAKHRNGPTGQVHLTFVGEHMRFENQAHYAEDF